MRFLVCEWTAYMQQDLEDCLHEYGIDTIEYGYSWVGNFEKDDYFYRHYKEIVKNEKDNIDAVISLNYMAPLSIICFELGILYIAWVYDCPFGLQHPEETIGLPTNNVFFFDRAEAEQFMRMGFDTVYHLPLAVNTSRLDTLTESIEGWKSDVTFVGIMYENDFAALYNHLPKYEAGLIDGLLKSQSVIYGSYFLRDVLEGIIDEKWKRFFIENEEIQRMPLNQFIGWVEDTVAREITKRERTLILSFLSKHAHTCLYSPVLDRRLSEVDYKGIVSAYEEAPKVYRQSKINLNITLKNITSGIPLRALEIMGSGGFLLSNYQPEIAENFEDGKEVVLYDSVEDGIRKALYFLSHEDERVTIAVNGRKAAERFSFMNQVGYMLKTVFGNDVF